MEIRQPGGGFLTDQNTNEIIYLSTFEIGDWNMDTTALKTVATGMALSIVRAAHAFIRNDADTSYFSLEGPDSLGAQGGMLGTQANQIFLYRTGGGRFDNAGFDSIAYNRGWVQVWHT